MFCLQAAQGSITHQWQKTTRQTVAQTEAPTERQNYTDRGARTRRETQTERPRQRGTDAHTMLSATCTLTHVQDSPYYPKGCAAPKQKERHGWETERKRKTKKNRQRERSKERERDTEKERERGKERERQRGGYI